MRHRSRSRAHAPRLETLERRELLSGLVGAGFESPRLTTAKTFQARPAGQAWTYQGNAGVTNSGSAFSFGNQAAPEGLQAAYIQGTGAIRQTVADLPEGTYRIQFKAAKRASHGGANDLRITVDGVNVGTADVTRTNYFTYASSAFTLGAGTHQVVIQGLNSRGGDNTALVDEVGFVSIVTNVQDPGFEVPALAPSTFRYNAIGSWAFLGSSGVAANGSGFSVGNPAAPEGRQAAFLQGTGRITQTVAGLNAGAYRLEFKGARRGNYGGVNDFRITVDGVAAGRYAPSTTSYQVFAATFAVEAGAHVIAFEGINSAGGDNTALLDDFRLFRVGSVGQTADADFESPAIAGGGFNAFAYRPTGSAWTFAGSAGLAVDGSGFTFGVNAPEGRQVAFVQGTGSVSQTVAGMAAGSYRLNLKAVKRANTGGVNDLRVSIDGVEVGVIDVKATAYRAYYTNAFRLEAGAHTIRIEGLNSRGGDNTALIDLVRFESADAFDTPATGASLGGVNLGYNDFYTVGPLWTDVTKLITGWGQLASPWLVDPTIPLTADGYPLANAGGGTPMIGYPKGVYTLTYNGSGTVTVGGLGYIASGSAETIDGHTRASVVINRTFDESGGSQLFLFLSNINPNDPIRDLQLTMPGYEPSTAPTFSAEFVEKLRPFSSIRMMDWFNTNDSTLKNWADRTTGNSFLQATTKGVAYEHAIELANATRKDLWLTVPLEATDDYVREMARLFRDGLDPGLRLYVEYSNEIWNFAFSQATRNIQLAWADNRFTATDDWGRSAQRAALRTVEIGRIFRAEFGVAAERIRPVLGGQAVYTYFQETGLKYLQQAVGPPAGELFGMAIAPYFALEAHIDKPGLTLDQMFNYLYTAAPEQARWVTQMNRGLADRYGLPLLAYEGGQAITAYNGVNVAVKRAAQTDPRMGRVVRDYYNSWMHAGGTLMQQYTLAYRPAPWGDWGLLTGMSDPGSPKYDGHMAAFLTPGDADRDADVDDADFQILAANYKRPGTFWRSQGDMNLDNLVNDADLAILRRNVRGLTSDRAAEVSLFGVPATSDVNVVVPLRGVEDPSLATSWRIERGGALMAQADTTKFDWRPTTSGTYVIKATVLKPSGETATRERTIVIG